jgi:leucyl/phenylalanyl-tRNA---protein transferase
MINSGSRWAFDPESADEHGLVGVGADLEPSTLLDAYSSGVFPTRFEPYSDPSFPMFWWSPDPRAIFELDNLHISRRLARTLKSNRFRVTFNQNFQGVMAGCADRPEGTWITQDILDAYERLHVLGYAHSVEVWREQQLAGGTYGVAIGGLFAAESMFFRVTDASKVALVALRDRLRDRGFSLWDIQLLTQHTERMGAIEIPRHVYLDRLKDVIESKTHFSSNQLAIL